MTVSGARRRDGEVVRCPTCGQKIMRRPPSDLEIAKIIVADAFGLPIKAILGNGQSRPVSRARHALMYLLYMRGHAVTDIGAWLHRDHTTVIHGCRRIEDRMVCRRDFARLMDELRARLDRDLATARAAKIDETRASLSIVRLGLAALAIAGAVVAATPAFAQRVPCAQRDDWVSALREGYGEERIVTAVTDGGRRVEVFRGESGGWTILMTLPNGLTCGLASGQGWEAAPAAPAAPPPAAPKGDAS